MMTCVSFVLMLPLHGDKNTDLLDASMDLLKQAESPNAESPEGMLKLADKKLNEVAWLAVFNGHHWAAVKDIRAAVAAIEKNAPDAKIESYIDQAMDEIKTSEALYNGNSAPDGPSTQPAQSHGTASPQAPAPDNASGGFGH